MLSLLLACVTLSSPEPPPASPQVVADRAQVKATPQQTMRPPYFSAQQLQAAMTPGTRLVFETTVADAPPERMVWQVLSADDQGMELRTTQGQGEPTERTLLWQELALQSSFVEEQSELESPVQIVLPLATLSGSRYTVTDPGAEVSVFEFADALPGPPVRMVQKVAGQRRMTMVLIEHSSPAWQAAVDARSVVPD